MWTFLLSAHIKNSSKFKGNHLSWSLFFNKVVGLRPAPLQKKKRLKL